MTELTYTEMQEIEGGVLWFVVGYAVGMTVAALLN